MLTSVTQVTPKRVILGLDLDEQEVLFAWCMVACESCHAA